MKTKHRKSWVGLSALIIAWFAATLALPEIALAAAQKTKTRVVGTEIKHVTSTGFNVFRRFFVTDVSCDENFLVQSVYAQMNDPDNDIDISYVVVPSPILTIGFLGGGAGIAVVDGPGLFNPAADGASTQGYELLSHFQVNQHIGVPADGKVRITGVVESTFDSTDDTIRVGVVLEALEDATCGITHLLQGPSQ